MKYNAVIIGAGSIGALKPWPFDLPGSKNILTHANACHTHKLINLFGIIDTDHDKAKRASEKWGVDYWWGDLPSFLYNRNQKIDIFIVATPTETHKEVLLDILKIKPEWYPKIVIAEKPFCSNSKEAEEIIKAYKEKNIHIIVDYIRDYSLDIQKLKNEIYSGHYGIIYSVICHYVRGLVHEGCHAINLFNKFLGDIIFYRILSSHVVLNDYIGDPSYSVHLQYEKCRNVFMFPVNSKKAFNVFDIEIMTEKGKISLLEHGKIIEFRPTIPESTYGEYETLSPFSFMRKQTDLTQALLNLLEDAIDVCRHKDEKGFNPNIKCNTKNALQVHKILERIKID